MVSTVKCFTFSTSILIGVLRTTFTSNLLVVLLSASLL